VDAKKTIELKIILMNINDTIGDITRPPNEIGYYSINGGVLDRVRGGLISLLKEEVDTIERILKENEA